MADISAKDVMALRNKTGLAMMACKKALAEAGGDPEKAEELLRKQLKGKMDTKMDRAAGEGRIAVATDGNCAAIVEVKAETDFTAKNEKFIAAADQIAAVVLAGEVGAAEASDETNAPIDDLRISTGENISFGRGEKLPCGEDASFGSYVHHDGKTGVLIRAEGDITDETLRQLCMHITAAVPRPVGITTEDIPEDIVEKERKFRTEQAVESGKPQEIAEKMVEGGMKKFYATIALLEQDFVMDPSKKVKDLVGGATITHFRRWQVGEEG